NVSRRAYASHACARVGWEVKDQRLHGGTPLPYAQLQSHGSRKGGGVSHVEMATPGAVISQGFVPSLSTCQRSPGASLAPTAKGTFDGMPCAPVRHAWEPDSVLYGLYAPDQPRNSGHVNDSTITAMLKEQRRTKDREARKQLIFDIQRSIAEQQYYVYLYCIGITGSWYPYVKHYAPNTQLTGCEFCKWP